MQGFWVLVVVVFFFFVFSFKEHHGCTHNQSILVGSDHSS